MEVILPFYVFFLTFSWNLGVELYLSHLQISTRKKKNLKESAVAWNMQHKWRFILTIGVLLAEWPRVCVMLDAGYFAPRVRGTTHVFMHVLKRSYPDHPISLSHYQPLHLPVYFISSFSIYLYCHDIWDPAYTQLPTSTARVLHGRGMHEERLHGSAQPHTVV